MLKQNLTDLIPLENSEKKIHGTNKKGQKTNYMAQLSRKQIEELYKMYWLDFEMFGYDVSEYLKMV